MRGWPTLGLVLALALPLAGCLADDDAKDTQSNANVVSTSGTPTPARAGASGTAGNHSASGNATAGNGTVSGNATTPTGNATGNATAGNGTASANETAGNATHVEYDNRTGTVAGTGIPLVRASFEKTEAIDVSNGTLNLTLNLTSTGDAITVEVQPAGCDTDDCTITVESEDGRADLGFDDPVQGTWNVTLSVSGIGPVSADYELTVATELPGAAAP